MNKRQDLIELLADSDTSLNFTHEQSDLSEFQEVHDDDFDVQTAAKSPPLVVKGGGGGGSFYLWKPYWIKDWCSGAARPI